MSEIDDSILLSVKKALGLGKDYTPFDVDITMHINSAFAILYQLGVGPEEPFMIEDESAVWSDFHTSASMNLVRSYIYLKVRLLFDSPNGSVLTSFQDQVKEYEWRLNVEAETPAERSFE